MSLVSLGCPFFYLFLSLATIRRTRCSLTKKNASAMTGVKTLTNHKANKGIPSTVSSRGEGISTSTSSGDE